MVITYDADIAAGCLFGIYIQKCWAYMPIKYTDCVTCICNFQPYWFSDMLDMCNDTKVDT